jgi:signal transduction histidine kinase
MSVYKNMDGIQEHAGGHSLSRNIVEGLSDNELRHLARLITMGELSACFAHEVFNPLMVIRGHLRFMKEGLLPDHPVRTNLDVIERTSRHIEEMAKRMLDFSKKQTFSTELCDPAELVMDALTFMNPYIHVQHVSVQINCEAGLPSLEVDRFLIVQVLVNLIQNATDAMIVSERRVLTISALPENGRVRISVADTGPGISSEVIPQLFDPFFTTKGKRGSGLGLYIAKRTIQEYGGSIDVQTGSCGTTFFMSFPGR